MSIYATLWGLKFPQRGQFRFDSGWVTVMAQGVPEHVGEDLPDPYAEFLPPRSESISQGLRAIVFVTRGAEKGTERSGQEYIAPLLTLSGKDYAVISFAKLHRQICAALANRPALSDPPSSTLEP